MPLSLKLSLIIVLIIILTSLPVISQDVAPTPDLILTLTQTPTLTATATYTASLTVSPEFTVESETTAESTAEVTLDSIETTLEVTAEITETVSEATPELTVEITETVSEITPEATVEITAEATEEVTSEVTETVLETTPELIVELTEESTAISSVTPTATPGGIALTVKSAIIQYQNRLSHEGIKILIISMDDVLLSVAESNAEGIYTVPVPADEAFILVAEAPLHRRLEMGIDSSTALPELKLVGGDLNADGCINQADITILLAFYEQVDTPQSDINADGITNLSDLAILTGNYDGTCEEPLPELMPEPEPLFTATIEATVELTPLVELTIEVEETAETNP